MRVRGAHNTCNTIHLAHLNKIIPNRRIGIAVVGRGCWPIAIYFLYLRNDIRRGSSAWSWPSAATFPSRPAACRRTCAFRIRTASSGMGESDSPADGLWSSAPECSAQVVENIPQVGPSADAMTLLKPGEEFSNQISWTDDNRSSTHPFGYLVSGENHVFGDVPSVGECSWHNPVWLIRLSSHLAVENSCQSYLRLSLMQALR